MEEFKVKGSVLVNVIKDVVNNSRNNSKKIIDAILPSSCIETENKS